MSTTGTGPPNEQYFCRFSLASPSQKALVTASSQHLVVSHPFQLRFQNTSTEKRYGSLVDEIHHRHRNSMKSPIR